ncbi:MAG: phosphatase PAP2 family protein [Prevotella sp.]|jgi:undecaprenyl-diphosphatase|nr:phosphatase PAP2 family protein [Prevotella sp.]
MHWIELDKQWLLALNGSDSVFLDSLVKTLTTATTWIPLYVALLYIVIKNSDSLKQILIIVGCALLCVFLAGSLDDMIVKPLVGRWRPARDPDIGISVDIVNGYRGGRFGFFSAHASNTFSLAVFFIWLIRSRLLSVGLVIWSLVNCWTRIYLGVHFPGDILVGLLWGAVVGTCVWVFYSKVSKRAVAPANYVSSQYTKTGFLRKHADIPLCALVAILIYALIKACFI